MIRIKDIYVQYGKQNVLDAFSLDLPERGRIALMGPSGSGKSTLLLAMAGLISYQGRITGLSNRRIGLLFQEDRLLPQSTAVQNVAAVLTDSMKKKQRYERAGEVLLACGLSLDAHNKYPDELSGGMKKRVAIARLLAYDCNVWLLDEPFRGLDAQSREGIISLLLTLSDNKLMVIVSHDPYEASSLGERTVQLGGPPLHVIDRGDMFDQSES